MRAEETYLYNRLTGAEEYRMWPVEARQDQHRLPVQREIRW